MTEEHDTSDTDSRELEQKEIYIECPDGEAEPYKEQPQRKYQDKIVKGIAIGRGANRQIIELEQVRRLAMLNTPTLAGRRLKIKKSNSTNIFS